ncbi:MAG: PilZ domain-containing protein [Terriglobales bacterium]
MSVTTGLPAVPLPHRKAVACAALFDLSDESRSLVAECFRHFGIDTLRLAPEDATRLQTEKFEACVLPLEPSSTRLIELARSSASNSRIVIFGVGGSAQDAMRYSKLCINAMFQEPLERTAALKLVRSARTLVMHEFRRYVRIPVMTEVGVAVPDGGRLTATSREISCGGMSLKSSHLPEMGSIVEVSFSLLTLPRMWVRGKVVWRKVNKTFGIRFDSTDDRRQRLKDWITSYLEP